MSDAEAAAAPLEISQALGSDAVDQVRALFREYEAEIGGGLCFQGFAAELASLPGAYASPSGRLLLAREGPALAGCVALRPLDAARCEMKRLYLRPAFRGRGHARRLAEAAIAAARAIGYRRICLDTLPTMTAARALYADLGFAERPVHGANPPGVLHLERELRESA